MGKIFVYAMVVVMLVSFSVAVICDVLETVLVYITKLTLKGKENGKDKNEVW